MELRSGGDTAEKWGFGSEGDPTRLRRGRGDISENWEVGEVRRDCFRREVSWLLPRGRLKRKGEGCCKKLNV
jgi:hypothetical protein